jgi:hypothetical protein
MLGRCLPFLGDMVFWFGYILYQAGVSDEAVEDVADRRSGLILYSCLLTKVIMAPWIT